MDIWKLEESFNNFYDKFVIENKDNFNEMKKQRKKASIERIINKRIIWAIEILLFIVIIAWFICVGAEEEDMFVPEFCGMLALLTPPLIALFKRKELDGYDLVYQEKIIKNLLRHFSSDLEFFPRESIDGIDYPKIGPGKYTDFYSTNVIKGKYKNSDVLIALVNTAYTYDRKVYKGLFEGWETKSEIRGEFLGLFMKVKLAKSTKTDLYLKNRAYLEQKVFDDFLGNVNNLEQKNITNVEVYGLNEVFEVYSHNLESAEQILNSEMKNLLMSINERQNFEFVIKDEYIYIRFWGSTFFAAPQLRNVPEAKEILYQNYEIFYLIFLLLNKFEEM